MKCAPKDTRTIDAMDQKLTAMLEEGRREFVEKMEVRRRTETDLIGELTELRAERGDLRRERDNLLAENAALQAELDRLNDFLKRI